MTEIPEHLLERSRSRRAALGLEGGGGDAPATSETAATPAAPSGAAAPAKAAAAKPVEMAARPEVVLSPYAQAADRRKKIPFWAVPVLLFLPLWGFLYWGTLDEPPAEVTGLLAVGQERYGLSCAACHGGAGAGVGAIPGLTETHLTFPDYAGQVWFIVNGSAAVPLGSPYGDLDRPGGPRISAGGMPGWANAMTAREILGVVYYERERFAGVLPAELDEIEAIADNPELPERFAEGATLEEITELLELLVPAVPAS